MSTGAEIRTAFLDYFKGEKHPVVPSASLIPQGDPSLLFTSAGMVPFKPYFLGVKRDLSRAASCQKSFRTTDIERVGTTIRHLTFFEMLGNFSFGDYFKSETIGWCWDFLTRTMKLDKKLLHVSIFKDDDEAERLWKKHDVKHPIVKLGEDTNFWTMGPTGPCGPCSEVYFDRGPEHGCGKPSCGVGCDCDRYLEVWNLVFTQFDRQEDGRLEPLPRKNIDTGMGLERLTLVVQGKRTPFETDLFWPIMEKAAGILETLPGQSHQNKRIFRILGDHSRAAAFLVAEGVIPSNEGRGYILRRLIRRALSQGGLLLKEKKPFVHELASEACRMFGSVYPELKKHAKDVRETVRQEESNFLATLEQGEAQLREILEKKPKVLSGEEAFKLYDTFGFPLELTKERLAAEGIEVDERAFEAARERAKGVARQGWKGSGQVAAHQYQHAYDTAGPTKFVGYDKLESDCVIKGHVSAAGQLSHPSDMEVFLDQTPFYPEGGGQVGDVGTIEGPGFKLDVVGTLSPMKGLVVHSCRIVEGDLNDFKAAYANETKVRARVDPGRRERSMCHHTATHLLNAALRKMFGPTVRQAGSYVGPDRLRFDYTLSRAPKREELSEIERIVNTVVQEDQKVCPMERPAADIEKFGAVTLVGEDYGSKPRFVWIGPECWKDEEHRFSLELCGGTHVHHTGEVGFFRILKESSVSAGTRRIEAVAGPAAIDYLLEQQDRLHRLAQRLQVPPEGLEAKLDSILKSEKELRQEIAALKQRLLAGKGAEAETEERDLEGGGKLIARRLDGAHLKDLRGLADKAQKQVGSGAVFLAAVQQDAVSFVLSVSPDLVGRGLKASEAAAGLAKTIEGKAGGRPEFAQGGGKPTKNLKEMADELERLLRK